jgi:hypothetical protein
MAKNSGQTSSTKSVDRVYSVFKEIVVDSAKPPAEAVEQIVEAAQAKGKARIEILVRVARADGNNPSKALEKAALDKGLNGDYAIAADSSITTKTAESGSKPFAKIS